MASTQRRIGATRTKLAVLLSEALTNEVGVPVEVYPEDLWIQNPFYASKYMDCCRWGASFERRIVNKQGHTINARFDLSSWTTMTRLVREKKIDFLHNDSHLPYTYEIA